MDKEQKEEYCRSRSDVHSVKTSIFWGARAMVIVQWVVYIGDYLYRDEYIYTAALACGLVKTGLSTLAVISSCKYEE